MAPPLRPRQYHTRRRPPAPQHDQDAERAGRVDDEIAGAARAHREHGLVGLVDERAQETHAEGDPGGGVGRPPGPREERPEPEQREDGVLGQMAHLAQHHVDRLERGDGHAGQDGLQDGQDERGGLAGGKRRRAEHEDERHPEHGWRIAKRDHLPRGYQTLQAGPRGGAARVRTGEA